MSITEAVDIGVSRYMRYLESKDKSLYNELLNQVMNKSIDDIVKHMDEFGIDDIVEGIESFSYEVCYKYLPKICENVEDDD